MKEKEKLIEEIGVYFEKSHLLPPLTARILALLILCPRDGHSFDDVVELTKSSKSSVSTSINLLLQNGSIEYFTKHGDRKRYFRSTRNYLEVSLKKYKDRVAEELKISEKISEYNRIYNETKYLNYKEIGDLYREYLRKSYENLESTLEKMSQIENIY